MGQEREDHADRDLPPPWWRPEHEAVPFLILVATLAGLYGLFALLTVRQ